MWHVVSSDNSGATDFKYVFDIWINGVQKIRVKQFPEPGTGKAYFDAGPTVRNEMTYGWFEPINSSVLVRDADLQGEAGIVYALRVGEDFSGLTTLNMASGETSGYNWATPMFKRRVVGLADKINRWFTNRPLTASAAIGENLFIPFYTQYTAETMEIRVRTYNHSNAFITQYSGTVKSAPLIAGFIQCNIGTTALTATTGAVFDGSVKYYDVGLWQLSPGEHPAMRVYITCNPKFTCIPIHFMNRWGMWDTHRFDLVSKLNMDIDRKGFGQRDYQLNGNAVDYYSASNRYYEGKINYSNKANWSYKLTSDALSDAEYEWMADLMTSPQILLELDGYFYPVTIKKTTYEYNKFVTDRLKAFEVEFEFNSERMTQLR